MLKIFCQVHSKQAKLNEITRDPQITPTSEKNNTGKMREGPYQRNQIIRQFGSKWHSLHLGNKQCLKAGLWDQAPYFVHGQHQTESRIPRAGLNYFRQDTQLILGTKTSIMSDTESQSLEQQAEKRPHCPDGTVYSIMPLSLSLDQ